MLLSSNRNTGILMHRLRVILFIISIFMATFPAYTQTLRFFAGASVNGHFDQFIYQGTPLNNNMNDRYFFVERIDPQTTSNDFLYGFSLIGGMQFWEFLDVYAGVGYSSSSSFFLIDKGNNHVVYSNKKSIRSSIQVRYNQRISTILSFYVHGGVGLFMSFSEFFRYAKDGAAINLFTVYTQNYSYEFEKDKSINLDPFFPFGGGISIRFGEYHYSRISVGYSGLFILADEPKQINISDMNDFRILTLYPQVLLHGITIEYAYIF